MNIRVELEQRDNHNLPNFDSIRCFIKTIGGTNIRVINKNTNQPDSYTFSIDNGFLTPQVQDILSAYGISIWDRTSKRWYDESVYSSEISRLIKSLALI